MSLLITVIIFSILIIIHEFGHFIAARRAGIRVERFAIGFGPALLKIKGKETDFLVCLIPLGGYVKMAGDTRPESKGERDEFLPQSPGTKMRVVFAGPFFNYLLAAVLFCVIAFLGFPYRTPVVGSLLEGYPAQNAGLQVGDRIRAVDGTNVDTWEKMARLIYRSKGNVVLTVDRQGEELLVEVSLEKEEIVDDYGRKRKASIIGIGSSNEIAIAKYGFPKALWKGIEALIALTVTIITGFIFIATGTIPLKDAVGGPIAIYSITADAISVGLVPVLQLTAALNVTLAIVNLLPIPVLDGGHLFFLAMEKLRKRPLREKTEEIVTRIGLALIGLLVVFVFYNDSIKYGPDIVNKLFGRNRNTQQPLTAPESQKEPRD